MSNPLGFKYDAFISYGWLDDRGWGDAERPWVTHFSRDLETRLSQFNGVKSTVWRDSMLSRNQQIWPAIQKAIRESELFVSVISPRYVNSESCRMEYEYYADVNRELGITVQTYNRAFAAIKLPVLVEQRPTLYQDQNGYDFFVSDRDTGIPLEWIPQISFTRRGSRL